MKIKRFLTIIIAIMFIFTGISTCNASVLQIKKIKDNSDQNIKPSSSENIYVDDDADSGWYDSTHVRTIQESIQNSSGYNDIYVYNGTYYENVVISKKVTLYGENRNNTIIDGNAKASPINILVDGVKIDGFTIKNSRKKILDLSGSSGIFINSNYNIISNNTITENIKGIYFNECNNNTIENNYFVKNRVRIIILFGEGISIIYSKNNVIRKNTFKDNIQGIALTGSENNNITENIFEGNRIGVYASGSNYNTIHRNTIKKCGNGIFLTDSLNTKTSSKKNVIKRNLLTLNRIGIFTTGAADNTITENNFILNIKNAKFMIENFTHLTNKYSKNYWNRPRIMPKVIFGFKLMQIPFIPKIFRIPLINIDWHPAIKPYEI